MQTSTSISLITLLLTTRRHFLQHFDAMRYRASDKTEAFHCAARLARQADYQRFVHHHRKVARQNRIAGDLHGFHPHRFAKPGQLADGDFKHCFGRHVTQRDAGAAGGQDEMTPVGDLLANGPLDFAFFVRDEVLSEDAPAVPSAACFSTGPPRSS